MAVYNLTNLTSANDPLKVVQEVNVLSDNHFGIMLFLTLLFIIGLTLRRNTQADNEVIVSATLWFGVIIGFMLTAIDLIGLKVLVPVIALSIGSVGLLYARR